MPPTDEEWEALQNLVARLDSSLASENQALQDRVVELETTLGRLLQNGLEPALVNKLESLPAGYSTTVPTDTPKNGTFRFVRTGGVSYIYARLAGAWVRAVMIP